MNFFKKYTTPFGYIADGNKIDAYGVDHSGFSTRDEVEYQFARQERESQLADNLNQQGIKEENYPKLGTSFWGNNPENNYGFGSSNIHDNIENRNNNSFENTTILKTEITIHLKTLLIALSKTELNRVMVWKMITKIKLNLIIFLDTGIPLPKVKKFGITFNNKKVLSNLGVKINLVMAYLGH